MAKQEFTTEQILDALQTHKTVQKAAKALGISYPEMQKYLKRYGIKTIPATELPPLPCKPLFEQKIEYPISEEEASKPWYKRFFSHGKESNWQTAAVLLGLYVL